MILDLAIFFVMLMFSGLHNQSPLSTMVKFKFQSVEDSVEMLLPFFNLDLLIVIRLLIVLSTPQFCLVIYKIFVSIQCLQVLPCCSLFGFCSHVLVFLSTVVRSIRLFTQVLVFLSWRSFAPTDVVEFIFSFIYFLSVILSHDFCCIHPIFFLFNPQFSSQADLLCKTFWRPGPGCSKGRQRYAPNQ